MFMRIHSALVLQEIAQVIQENVLISDRKRNNSTKFYLHNFRYKVLVWPCTKIQELVQIILGRQERNMGILIFFCPLLSKYDYNKIYRKTSNILYPEEKV